MVAFAKIAKQKIDAAPVFNTKTTQISTIIHLLAKGLPIEHRPYQNIAKTLNITEEAVVDLIKQMEVQRHIKRFGIIIHHRKLGYIHNAMVVWDIEDALVEDLGKRIAQLPFVNLCYLRPRRLPQWHYNLFTMIHSKSRAAARDKVNLIIKTFALQSVKYDILFSTRCFKQCGAQLD